ncbi:hypothetical protein F0L68_03850 [Solihabitans fulvus]|uniref:Uncharacterized protein n=1 Tax=Solihabitans fulvus TaxID=1892852 RepID=A0A5B2XRI5_9PSEU|nr:DUF6204 family protein [Solihabitans fulvus]KAA2265715.1 hypothetical protein F0L68_03850 [Solihabitans fulvus]
MTQRDFRVKVRGRFDQLTEQSRATLLAEAAEHDVLNAGFSQEGTFCYRPDLVAFTFRFLISATGEDAADAAEVQAELRAAEVLAAAGHGYRDLRVDALDVADIKVNRKHR